MNTDISLKRSPIQFCIWLLILSIPFWVFAALADQFSDWLPINIPISGLMFVNPFIAAIILVYREGKLEGIKRLLKKTLDFKSIRHMSWFAAAFLLAPLILLLSYWIMRLLGRPLPPLNMPIAAIPIFFIVFFITATLEETGWMSYLAEPLLTRWSALKSSIIMGSIWAIWHVIPYIQGNNSLQWILWQCLYTAASRVLIFWLYNNTGKSVLAAILYHAMYNVSTFVFPNYGSHYDPVIVGAITIIAAVAVTFVWGPRTLAQYRYEKSSAH